MVEFDGHDRVFWPASNVGFDLPISGNVQDLRFFENGGVKPGRRLSLVIEPQKWRNFLHDLVSFMIAGRLSPGTRQAVQRCRTSLACQIQPLQFISIFRFAPTGRTRCLPCPGKRRSNPNQTMLDAVFFLAALIISFRLVVGLYPSFQDMSNGWIIFAVFYSGFIRRRWNRHWNRRSSSPKPAAAFLGGSGPRRRSTPCRRTGG